MSKVNNFNFFFTCYNLYLCITMLRCCCNCNFFFVCFMLIINIVVIFAITLAKITIFYAYWFLRFSVNAIVFSY